ncbi:alpha/beta fold hydrolase [Naumannella huperziae]
MTAPEPRELEIAVDGGTLHAFSYDGAEPDAPLVLALHGITGNHLAWAPLHRRVPGHTILAPDLRGRGLSSELPGPFGIARHADDAAAVLAEAGAHRPVVVVGHSMGAFVAAALAVRHPQLVERLVLVDGGAPLPKPPGMERAELSEAARAALGPAAERLSATFPTRDAYLAMFREHPALRDAWDADIEAYAGYDLAGTEPELASRTSAEAMLADFAELFVGGAAETIIDRLDRPAVALRAPRGLLDAAPLYPQGYLDTWASTLPHVTVAEVPDVNHYTIALGTGADRIAAELRG